VRGVLGWQPHYCRPSSVSALPALPLRREQCHCGRRPCISGCINFHASSLVAAPMRRDGSVSVLTQKPIRQPSAPTSVDGMREDALALGQAVTEALGMVTSRGSRLMLGSDSRTPTAQPPVALDSSLECPERGVRVRCAVGRGIGVARYRIKPCSVPEAGRMESVGLDRLRLGWEGGRG
jgi:hypothetical protein